MPGASKKGYYAYLKRDYWRGFGKYNMPKPGIDTFFASDDWNKIICEKVNEKRHLKDHHALSISPSMSFEDTYVFLFFSACSVQFFVAQQNNQTIQSIYYTNSYNESAGGKRFIVRYVPKSERTYDTFQGHTDEVNMSVSINVGIFTDAAGNTNANASNMTFKLTSKRRTVHISTNVTDATSSYIPVWIRTEVPVWPDISESDIHVLHARMSKFRRINSTTYSFLLQPPSTVQPASKPLTVNLNSHRWRSHYNERFEAMTFSWYPDTDSPVLNLHTPSLEIPVRRKSHSKHEHLK